MTADSLYSSLAGSTSTPPPPAAESIPRTASCQAAIYRVALAAAGATGIDATGRSLTALSDLELVAASL